MKSDHFQGASPLLPQHDPMTSSRFGRQTELVSSSLQGFYGRRWSQWRKGVTEDHHPSGGD